MSSEVASLRGGEGIRKPNNWLVAGLVLATATAVAVAALFAAEEESAYNPEEAPPVATPPPRFKPEDIELGPMKLPVVNEEGTEDKFDPPPKDVERCARSLDDLKAACHREAVELCKLLAPEDGEIIVGDHAAKVALRTARNTCDRIRACVPNLDICYQKQLLEAAAAKIGI